MNFFSTTAFTTHSISDPEKPLSLAFEPTDSFTILSSDVMDEKSKMVGLVSVFEYFSIFF